MRVLPLFIFSALLLSNNCLAQKADTLENYIYWSDETKLLWTDFDELPQRYSEHAAFSVVGYKSQFEMESRYYKATVRTYFDRSESWAKNWVPILLSHEQGHFDLAEVYARKFRMKLKEAMESGDITINKFKQMTEDAMEQLEEAQKEYDLNTNFSMDLRAQLKWNEIIKEKLHQLSEFANPEVIVAIQAN